jgi:hypothetical protein
MRDELQLKYDSLCYATMINIKTKTSGAKRIVFRNFHSENKEHLFVMAVTMACWNILGEREVAIDCGVIARAKLSKKYKSICSMKKALNDEQVYVDVPEMLEFMRKTACDLCGEEFTFGDIYDAYYAEETR